MLPVWERSYAFCRTITGKAADKGAKKTVNGYMAFLLMSVAGLACKLESVLYFIA